MSGLGLTAALQGYQQGVDWNNQQKQVAVQNQQRQTIQQANQAGAQALQDAHDQDVAQQQAAWTQAGNDPSTFQPKPFQMTPQVLLAGMHARSDAIAQSGDLNLWTQNEAATAPIRNTIRQQVIGKALADYDATGDGAALAQAVYPTVHDGVSITGIKSGVNANASGQSAANAGQPAPTTYSISTSDGQTHTLTGDQIATMAHDAMMNPADTAKYEYESRLKAAAQAGQLAIDKAKAAAEGDEARKTEGVKGENAMQVEGLKSNTSLQVGQGNNAATIQSAGISAKGHVDAAGILADGRVEAAGLRAGGGPDGAKHVQKTLVDSDGYVVNVFKDGSMQRAQVNGQPVRSGDYGKRIDAYVKQLRSTPGNMSKSDAELRQAATQALSGTPMPAPAASGLTASPAPASGITDYSHLWAPGATQ